MSSFKLFWNIHKWTGLIAALFLAITATTGFLLLIKKRVDWIQPPTQRDVEGELDAFISIERLMEIVFAQGHEGFRTLDDIDRVDLRPDKRVYKVRSVHGYAEMQIGAISGEVLGLSWRPSDLFERIHDGSFFSPLVHEWLMPAVAIALLGLILTGIWLWIEPKLRRRRRRRGLSRR